MNDKLIEITDISKIKEMIKNEYLLVDDGYNEFVIKESDLPDYICNRNENIKVYKSNGEFLLSTIGCFLDKIDYQYRQKIIEKLINIQLCKIESKETSFFDSTILDYLN